MIILKRLMAIACMIPCGLLLIPALIIGGEKGADRVMGWLDPVMEWAEFDR